ncbi:MAG: fused MFS/spermidine synthase, partial [Myxococcales bacterium]|nr:fused MFS/spermidine synthase [Myxococcales bacterium]
MPKRAHRISALLFVSGLCALIYQVAWLKELRLVFGASTPASSVVLAVFMGGLGLGSLVLGKRAERVSRPLVLYGNLEAGIALTAAISPWLLDLARAVYVLTGGSFALGAGGSTVVRFLLSALVLLPPTFLMGGTLPAAARAAIDAGDQRRRSTALLYGLNTMGAVTGAAASTFVLLEVFGTRYTLWLGCALNGLIAMIARVYGRSLDEMPVETDEQEEKEKAAKKPLEPYALAAALGTGLAFLVMELVWYRVLSPLLGGSSYTFGLILAIALLGIGVGGLIYTWVGDGRPFGFHAFATTCALEALLLALPWALGDRVALFALFVRPLGTVGLIGHVVGWSMVTAMVVLPAALVAGFQFPLLIGILGRAERGVGRDVGLAYTFNTAGAIIGSLAGGFWLIPGLGTRGSWTLVVWLLVLLGAGALVVHWRPRLKEERPVRAALPAGLMLLALLMLHDSDGPTAFWRHSPIGAGRGEHYYDKRTINGLMWHVRERRRGVTWETDGRESSVALYTLNDTSFLVNGKSDGSAVIDGGTQVMGGLIGALIHPEPIRRAMVIGFGSGSTAGWLGALPEIERVDAVELEPAMKIVAEACRPVNHDALANAKIDLSFGDAREVLLTTPERYDLVFSEPSNPYRAGVASLFTREFYRAIADRLNPGGVFLQWIQAYEIDARSIRTIYATLAAVFPRVETWRTKSSDLILVARSDDRPIDLDELRRRVTQPPYREALMSTWRVDTAEGVLSRFVAGPGLAKAIAEAEGEVGVNTDDRNVLEFSVARAVGRPHDFEVEDLQEASVERGEALPAMVGDLRSLDLDRIWDAMVTMNVVESGMPARPMNLAPTEAAMHRRQALVAWMGGQPRQVIAEWEAQPLPPTAPVMTMAIADAYAIAGDEAKAMPIIEHLRTFQPVEADAIVAKLRWARGDALGAWEALERAIIAYRTDPWPSNKLMASALSIASAIGARQPALNRRIYDALSEPFVVHGLHYLRIQERLTVSLALDDPALCVAAVADFTVHF